MKHFTNARDGEICRARRVHLEGIIGVFPWIATVDAFQHWIYTHSNHMRDKAKALNDYKKSLELGGSRPLPELFSTAGCHFEFSEKTIQPLAKMLRKELANV